MSFHLECGIAIEEGAWLSKGGPILRFRIASKKSRYTLELFTSLYGPGMNTSLDKIRRAQALLGEISETVRSLVSHWKSADGLMSWLRKRQRRKIDEFQR